MDSYIYFRKTTMVIWAMVIAVLIVLAGRPFAVISHAQGAATIWDGIYTDDQAKRGQTLYTDQCAACHGETPVGTAMAPGLTGDDFLADFGNNTMDQLFKRISQTMPANDPGKLTAPQVADVIAYLASANKWPAGMKEMPSTTDALAQIKIIKKP